MDTTKGRQPKKASPEVETVDTDGATTTEERAEVYAEGTPEADVKPGDAGTFAGDFESAVESENQATRKDLPKGYVPGTYMGEYTPAN